MSGHVHVAAGDLKQLHCDAWLLPTDDHFQISGAFEDEAGVQPGDLFALTWPENGRVVRLPGRESPAVWLGRIGAFGEDSSWYAGCVGPFVRAAAAEVPVPDGVRPLFAVNVLGTGEGGMAADKGAIHAALLPALYSAAEAHDVDLVLVCWGRRPYAAAQRTRRKLVSGEVRAEISPTWDLGPHADVLEPEALRLAKEAVGRNLVLFLGAGVSVSAGLPAWQGMLDGIARELEMGESEIERLHRLDFRDQAAILHRRLDRDSKALHRAVSAQLAETKYSLAHAHLASLPTTEAVTTNYDQLFESAARAVDKQIAVLPYEAVDPGVRWLLKLHGSIDRDNTIVLTRSDYLGVPARHGALFGLVQALLLTRHMLFVGYSLSDDDFHQLVEEVRHARGDREHKRKIGTVVTLFDDALFADLWSDDLHIVAMSEAHPDVPTPQEIAAASRTMQIFLDRVGYEAADVDAFLLDPTYVELLSEDEKGLAKQLQSLASRLPDTPTAKRVRRMLDELGRNS